MDFSKFVRKPFLVEAVEVTPDNIEELAPLIGTFKEKHDGTPFIQVNQRMVPNVYRVYTGFWVTKLDDQIRCYSKKAFFAQFMEADEETLAWIQEANNPVGV